MSSLHVLSILLVTTAVAAQPVQISARAVTDVVVTADSQVNRIPAGFDLSAGGQLTASAQNGNLRASANWALAVQSVGVPGPSVTLDESCSASGGSVFSAIGSSTGNHTVEVRFTASAPLPATLVVTYCASPFSSAASYSGTATLSGGGSGTVVNQSPSGWDCILGSNKRATFGVTVDPAGLVVTFRSQGGAYSASRSPYASSFGTWTLELRPLGACNVTPDGASCTNATLEAITSFAAPGYRIVLDDRGPTLDAAWLVAGIQRVAIPVAGCTLYTDPLIVLPFSLSGPNTAVVQLVPPPIPGLAFRLQGVTLTGVTLDFSNALAFSCP